MKPIIIAAVAILTLIVATPAAADQQVVMRIEGMSCALCTVAVQQSLTEVAGVKAVKVSYADKTARLTVDDAVSDQVLAAAVARSGPYTGSVVNRE